MKTCKLLSVVVAVASTLFVALSARAEFTCELSFPSAPATPLANFPALVRLAENAPTGFRYTDCPTTANLWFTDSNNVVLPFDADTWDTDGESLIWVSVPSLSSTATITMHWSDLGEYSPPSREVWTRAGYNAVWHFDGSYAESVTNLFPTLRGAPTYDGNASYPGPLGKTLWLNGSSDLRYVPDPAWTTLGDGPALSVSFWARVTGSAGFTRMVSCMSDWNKPAGYEFTLQSSYTKITVGTSGGSQLQTDITTGPNTAWKHFAGTYSGTTVKFYDDGEKKGEGTKNMVVAPTEALTLGGTGGTGTANPLTGGLDEIRIRRVTSSDDWVAAECATVTNNSYVTFGTVTEQTSSAAFDFGEVTVTSVSATEANFSVRLKGIGDNATLANLWFVVSGFGQTRVYPLDPATEPKIVVATLSGLQPGAEWTAYLTATNNASPAVGADSNPVAFTTLSDAGAGSPGLYQAVTHTSATPLDAAANWDIAVYGVVTLGPLAMRFAGNTHDIWTSVDGTGFVWDNNTGFGYMGYMYMEGGKDYYFGGAIDDAGYVWVDNGDVNWDAKRTGTQLGGYNNWNKSGPYAITKAGYYRVVFACWNNNGGAGAEQASVSLQPKLRYIALESGASAPAMGDEGWCDAVDPGDGSLFLSKAPTRAVSVLSAARDGMLLSSRVALGETFPGESSVLRYVYGATNGGNDPADWDGSALIASSLPATAVTNDYLVAIAADTRYVRFYTQDGDAVTWSATVSLDWAGETTIADAFLFLGEPDASLQSADRATLSAVLCAPGDGADSAQSWFVITGGDETRVLDAGMATGRTNITVAVSGLVPETEYSFYVTATNNAATPVGINSTVANFTTGNAASGWKTSSATFTPDGKSLTATIPITSLGVGTTTLYLMTGFSWNAENTVSASQVVSEPGVQTLSASFPDLPWGKVINYSFMLVNGTAENAITNWPWASGEAFHSKGFTITDDSTYTWVGGAEGDWNDVANWNRTAGSLARTDYAGYPVFGSTAVFATAAGDSAITVTIPATQGSSYHASEYCWITSTLDMDGMQKPLVFSSEDKTASGCRFKILSLRAGRNYNRLVFDSCNVYTINDIFKDKGNNVADGNGENFTVIFTGGTVSDGIGRLNINKPGVKIVIEEGASIVTGEEVWLGSPANPDAVVEIDNASLTLSNTAKKFEFDSHYVYNGAQLWLSGANASVTAGWFQTKYETSTNTVVFVIPAGGYSGVPATSTNAGYKFPHNLAGAPLTLKIDKDSPGLNTIRSGGIQLVQSAGGVDASKLLFEDVKAGINGFFFKDAEGNEYADAAAIETAGKTAAQITQIWYRHPSSGLKIYVR